MWWGDHGDAEYFETTTTTTTPGAWFIMKIATENEDEKIFEREKETSVSKCAPVQ